MTSRDDFAVTVYRLQQAREATATGEKAINSCKARQLQSAQTGMMTEVRLPGVHYTD